MKSHFKLTNKGSGDFSSFLSIRGQIRFTKSIIIERKYCLSFRKMLENGPSQEYFEVRSKQFEIKKLHIELYKEL